MIVYYNYFPLLYPFSHDSPMQSSYELNDTHRAAVSTPAKTGESPLSLAIKRGYEDICHTLCTNGADVSLRYIMPYNPHRHHLTSTNPDLTTAVPSTVADSTNQDDNTSVGSALSDTDVDALDLLAQADRYHSSFSARIVTMM